jgi:MarR family transcriptional regulator, 2-MHQ and catechol-resistance regulon repressor
MDVRTKTKVDTSGIHIWLVLWKAFRSVEAHAHRHISGLELGMSDFGILEVLMHKGPLSVQELGGKVMLTSGSMTAALDRLGRCGLIARNKDESDRRARVVRMTETGSAFIAEAFEDHKQAMETAVAGVAKKDRELLLRLLKKLGLGAVNSLEQLEEKGMAAKSGVRKNRKG